MRYRLVWVLALAGSLGSYTAEVTPARRATLDRISAESLRGHVSFLASDLLEGRDTPSPGLAIAAEYIAAQFRRAGLKPAGDDGYFQTARFVITEPSAENAEIQIHAADLDIRPAEDDLHVTPGAATVDFADTTPVKIDPRTATAEQVEGKVIVIATERPSNRVLAAVARFKPAAFLIAQPVSAVRPPDAPRQLEDAEHRRMRYPIIRIYNGDLFKLVSAAKTGVLDVRISGHVPPPVEKPVVLRNVAGILPGSDPGMAHSYVLVTAHYDHLGKKPDGDGDLIFNGANDDASGVASIIELAAALSAGPAPRRSVLFMAYFGEEENLLGSRYYARHPLVPLAQTAANLNLEQLGRFDGDGRAGVLSMTGFHYSDLAEALEMAAAASGVKIHDPGRSGDDFFNRSDNLSLADVGVPAHTIAASFDFPDYHQVGDEWEKLDYANLEKVDRAIALMIMTVADAEAAPHWNESNPKTSSYVRARGAK